MGMHPRDKEQTWDICTRVCLGAEEITLLGCSHLLPIVEPTGVPMKRFRSVDPLDVGIYERPRRLS